jgi:hypothetical protein
MISRSAQVWEVGEWVKVGFLTLRVTAKEPTPRDYAPDAYHLTNKSGDRNYRFVPHKGIERLLPIGAHKGGTQ